MDDRIMQLQSESKSKHVDWYKKINTQQEQLTTEQHIVLGMLGTPKKSLSHFQSALERDTKNPELHFLLGISLQGSWDGWNNLPEDQWNLPQARKELEHAILLDSKELQYDFYRIINLWKSEEKEAAVEALLNVNLQKTWDYDQFLIWSRVSKLMNESGITDKNDQIRMSLGISIFNMVEIQQVVKYALPQKSSLEIMDIVELNKRGTHIISLGTKIEQHAHLILEEAIGLAIQSIAYKHLMEIYKSQGLDDKSKDCETELKSITQRRNHLKKRISEGEDLWWSMEVKRLEREIQLGHIPKSEGLKRKYEVLNDWKKFQSSFE
jgi:hypothetical protein